LKESHVLEETAEDLSVLVVEDDLTIRETIVESLRAHGFAVEEAGTLTDGLTRMATYAFDGLVVDLRLPDGDGMSLLEDALGRYPELRAVVISGVGGVDEAVTAIKKGAADFLLKPFQLTQLVHVLKTAISERRLRRENVQLKAQLNDRFRFDRMVGAGPAMAKLFDTLELVAPMQSTVLIQGETGTGKELVARTIHHNSPRRDQPFVAFNAAAIPEGLAEAELFGHTKGAFTGAINARVGRFELADRGTLFIDEVASMPMPLQAKLLRALQEREVERVGTSRPLKINARVLAATNVDLLKLVREGTFREDLYYRLNVVRITIPPLRERREDIPVLVQHFLRESCHHNQVALRSLSQATMRLLMQQDWPGNIRQLENAVEHAVAMSSRTDEIVPSMLPSELLGGREDRLVPSITIPEGGISFASVMTQVERDLILQCLERTGGNRRQAAILLNLSRTTLIDKLQRLGLDAGSAA
jgi:DNA-binding NtrC family response regulator